MIIRYTQKETGMAYVAILILVAIMFTLGLTFLYKAATLTSTTSARSIGIQADYLAEVAINHAMWRIFNEPGFPTDETVYYMHSLVDGRYGYKVIKPSTTTFAGVATIGAMGDSWVLQRYVPYIIPEPIMLIYCKNDTSRNRYRRMVGASFDGAQPTYDIGSSDARWVELEGHPFKNEYVSGFLDGGDDIELEVWVGQSWGNHLRFISSSKKEHKGFDIAYDTYHGHAFVFGYDDNDKGVARYTVWDGSAWLADAEAFDTGSDEEIRYIDAEGCPTNGEILIAVLDQAKDIYLYRWDDISFYKLATLETNAAKDKSMVVNITYEQQSGEAVIVWAKDNSQTCKYVTWDGTSLSATADLPPFTDDGRTIRMAADPTSDTIFLAAIDKARHVYVAVWDGSSWTDSHRFETDSPQDPGVERINCDVAWESSGSEALAVWGKSGDSNAQYIRWDKVSALSSCAVQTGPDFQEDFRSVRMCPIPGTDRIILAVNNHYKHLRYCLWGGNKFRPDDAIRLTHYQPTEKEMAFDIAFPNYLAGPTAAALPNPIPCTPGNFLDEFNNVAYNNNDGSLDWDGNWIELDASGPGPSSGKVRITSGELRMRGTPAGNDPSLARQVNLYYYHSAILSFDFRTGSGVDVGEDSAVVEISDDGGDSWTLLEDFIDEGPSASGTRSYDISGYIATNTQVRFRINIRYGGQNEYFYVDDVEIAVSCNP